MATATKTRDTTTAEPATSKGELVLAEPRIPYQPALEEHFGVDKGRWRVLTDAIFPSARTADSIVLALDYCRSRSLDIMKRPVHIVPMWNSQLGREVETCWPGISELRTTASRTGEYAGCDAAEYGPLVTRTFKGKVKQRDGWKDHEETVEYPEWCRITVYRIIKGVRCAFVGPKVKWIETYATRGNSPIPNAMWCDRAEGQIEKCAEAAALRRAFPEEIGNEYTAEEMAGRRIETFEPIAPEPTKPTTADAGPPDVSPEPPKAAAAKPASEPPKAEPTKPTATKEPAQAGSAADPGDIPEHLRRGPDNKPVAPKAEKTTEPPPVQRTEAEQLPDEDAPDDDMADEEPAPRQDRPLPHLIPGSNQMQWVEDFLRFLETSETMQHFYEWIDANQTIFPKIKKPDAKAKLDSGRAQIMEALRNGGVVANQSKAVTKPAASGNAQTLDDIPVAPVPKSPEDQLKWIETILTRVENPDILAEVWERHIKDTVDAMFPPDREEAAGIYRHHEARLAP